MPKTLKEKDVLQIAKETIFAKENGHNVIIPHVCNNISDYPVGFSSAVSRTYPEVKTNYDLLGKHFLSRNPGYVQFIDVDREPTYNRRLIVATMIAQDGTNKKHRSRSINYAYLTKSMIEIKYFISKNFNEENKVYIYLSKNAFKNTGANWTFVNCLMQDLWSQINVEVF